MPQNEKNSAEGMGNKYEMGMDQYASLDPVAISCLIFGIFSAAAVFFSYFPFQFMGSLLCWAFPDRTHQKMMAFGEGRSFDSRNGIGCVLWSVAN